MKPGSENGVFNKNRYLTVGFVVVFALLAFIGCGKEKTEMVGVSFDPEKTPYMHTEDVATLISDSGITRYRINAKVWDVYSKAQEPYWYFPKKIHVEKFDTLFHVDASVKSDTAYYFTNKKLWQLIGNVKILTLQGDILETSELFWDQNLAEIYTDKFVRVQQQNGEVLTGEGCRSNQEMTNIRFYRASASVNVNKDSGGVPVDTSAVPVDTSAVQKKDTISSQP